MSGRFLSLLFLLSFLSRVNSLTAQWALTCDPDRACLHIEICDHSNVEYVTSSVKFVSESRKTSCQDTRVQRHVRLELKFASPNSGFYVITNLEEPIELKFSLEDETLTINTTSLTASFSGTRDKNMRTLKLIEKRGGAKPVYEAFEPIQQGKVHLRADQDLKSFLYRGNEVKVSESVDKVSEEVKKWVAKSEELGSRVCDFSKVFDACSGGRDCKKIPEAADIRCEYTLRAQMPMNGANQWITQSEPVECIENQWTIHDQYGNGYTQDKIILICSSENPKETQTSTEHLPEMIAAIAGALLVLIAISAVIALLILRRRRQVKRKRAERYKPGSFERGTEGAASATGFEPREKTKDVGYIRIKYGASLEKTNTTENLREQPLDNLKGPSSKTGSDNIMLKAVEPTYVRIKLKASSENTKTDEFTVTREQAITPGVRAKASASSEENNKTKEHTHKKRRSKRSRSKKSVPVSKSIHTSDLTKSVI